MALLYQLVYLCLSEVQFLLVPVFQLVAEYQLVALLEVLQLLLAVVYQLVVEYQLVA